MINKYTLTMLIALLACTTLHAYRYYNLVFQNETDQTIDLDYTYSIQPYYVNTYTDELVYYSEATQFTKDLTLTAQSSSTRITLPIIVKEKNNPHETFKLSLTAFINGQAIGGVDLDLDQRTYRNHMTNDTIYLYIYKSHEDQILLTTNKPPVLIYQNITNDHKGECTIF